MTMFDSMIEFVGQEWAASSRCAATESCLSEVNGCRNVDMPSDDSDAAVCISRSKLSPRCSPCWNGL